MTITAVSMTFFFYYTSLLTYLEAPDDQATPEAPEVPEVLGVLVDQAIWALKKVLLGMKTQNF